MKLMRIQWTSAVLIVGVGLVNLHIPHFILESKSGFSSAEYLFGLMLLVNFLASLVAALCISRSIRAGWIIGIIVCALSAILWLAQETVGLPGLPQQWLEPSRIAALAVEGIFVLTAWHQLFVERHSENDIHAT
jgi:hypothetical protein